MMAEMRIWNTLPSLPSSRDIVQGAEDHVTQPIAGILGARYEPIDEIEREKMLAARDIDRGVKTAEVAQTASGTVVIVELLWRGLRRVIGKRFPSIVNGLDNHVTDDFFLSTSDAKGRNGRVVGI